MSDHVVVQHPIGEDYDPFDLLLPPVRCMSCGSIVADKKWNIYINAIKSGKSEGEGIDEVAKHKYPEFWEKAQEQYELELQGKPNRLPTVKEIVDAKILDEFRTTYDEDGNMEELDYSKAVIDPELKRTLYFRRLYFKVFRSCCITSFRTPQQIRIGDYLGVVRKSTLDRRNLEEQTRRNEQTVSDGLNEAATFGRDRVRRYKLTDPTSSGFRVIGSNKAIEQKKLPDISNIDPSAISTVDISQQIQSFNSGVTQITQPSVLLPNTANQGLSLPGISGSKPVALPSFMKNVSSTGSASEPQLTRSTINLVPTINPVNLGSSSGNLDTSSTFKF